MAKSRKKARKAAAKRPAKKARRGTAKPKGRKVTKARSKAKPKRAKAPKQGVIAGTVQTVTDAIGLRSRMAGRNTFED